MSIADRLDPYITKNANSPKFRIPWAGANRVVAAGGGAWPALVI